MAVTRVAVGVGVALAATFGVVDVAVPAPPAAAATALPTADTTGVPAGRQLTPLAPGVVTASSTLLLDRTVQGDLTLTGSNVTVRNLRVTGHVIVRGDNVVIEDSELGSLALSGARNVRVSRVEVFGKAGEDGIHITSDTRRAADIVVEDTWIHNPQVTATSHYDGIQVRGVDRLTLRRIAVDLGGFQPQHNAALFLEDANGGNRAVTVESSDLRGGGYAFYSFAQEVRVRGTTFGGGRWGHLFPRSWLTPFLEFTGNRDAAGTTLGLSVAGGAAFVAADPAEQARKAAFVRALYTDFLGRAATQAEVDGWVLRLETGASRYEVATALSRTDQWISAMVTRFYRDTLGRDPDAAGLAYWVGLARQGRPMASIAAEFYASDEYLDRLAGGDLERWVQDLYAKLLYRTPDAGGLRHWLGILEAGAARGSVAGSFYQADETSRVRVEALYSALLGRRADASGLAWWPAVVRAEGDLVLSAYLASSDEYFARAQRR